MVITNASKLIAAQHEIEDLEIEVENYRKRVIACEEVNKQLSDIVHGYKEENIKLNSKLQCKTEHPWWKFWW